MLLGGDIRLASRHARLTLHTCAFELPRLGRHSAALLRDNAAALAEIDAEMAMIIGLHSRYPQFQLRQDMEGERSLDAAEAWLFGLLTERP